MSPASLSLRINGRRRSLSSVPDDERLLDTIRSRWRLTGTKEGCRSGSCGACTVLVDGRPVLSCLTLTHEAQGGDLRTIEGVGADRVGRVVRRAFESEGALQCGYCTPGFVMAVTGLLKERRAGAAPSDLEAELSGNLCRCTGYASIRRAVRSAQEELR